MPDQTSAPPDSTSEMHPIAVPDRLEVIDILRGFTIRVLRQYALYGWPNWGPLRAMRTQLPRRTCRRAAAGSFSCLPRTSSILCFLSCLEWVSVFSWRNQLRVPMIFFQFIAGGYWPCSSSDWCMVFCCGRAISWSGTRLWVSCFFLFASAAQKRSWCPGSFLYLFPSHSCRFSET